MVEQSELSLEDKKIIRQIEYYFGDVNLSRDKFLLEQIKVDDGWVPMETMLKFNRLKQITEDQSLIIEALKKSTSGLIEISEDKTKIRRNPAKPLPVSSKESTEDNKQRTIYAKGFPLDLKLDDAMEFFEKFGPVEHVQMRKDFKKAFKGSCFVTFKNKDGADNFIKSENTKYSDDTEMVKYYKQEYFDVKNKEKRNQTQKQKEEKEKKEIDSVKEKMVSGAILKVAGLPVGLRIDEVKQHFEKHGKVLWADVDEKDNTAKLRFSQKDEAKSVLEKLQKEREDGKILYNENEITCSVLEGEEEVEHWKEIFKSKASHQGGKKGGRKSSDGRGKRKQGGRSGPKAKKEKKEADAAPEDEGDGSE